MASNWNRYSTLPLVIGLASILLSPALRGADTLSTYLRLDDNVLRVTAEQPVRLSLTLPGGETWSQANVGHFQVRTYGKTESVPCHPDPDTGEVLYAFPSTGLALVILSVGPAASFIGLYRKRPPIPLPWSSTKGPARRALPIQHSPMNNQIFFVQGVESAAVLGPPGGPGGLQSTES